MMPQRKIAGIDVAKEWLDVAIDDRVERIENSEAAIRRLARRLVRAGFMSYFVGLAAMVVVVAVLRELFPPAALAARIPWWARAGGVFGAIYIALAIYLVPQLGAATFVALLIAGQMTASVAFDHYGWLGLPQRSADLPRLIGIVPLVAG